VHGCSSDISSAVSPSYDLFPTLHTTFGHLSSGWLVSYLVATLIIGIGLAVMAVVHVSQPMEVATRLGPVTEQQRIAAPKNEIVGRITGMVDCKWSDPKTTLSHNAQVPLGQKYALASGLMEITYDTGAKVILQGPVTYEVDANGGFLSIGKLTGKLERKVVTGQWPVASESNSKSLIPNLFAIRTPTATVTDLGTEFGVEVDKNGTTRSHVFRGSVRLESIGSDGTKAVSHIMHANESAAVERNNAKSCLTVQPIVLDPTVFVRSAQLVKLADEQKLTPFLRWQAYSNAIRRDPSLLAYYDFQQKPGEPGVLRNVAANGDKSLDGVALQATWTTGRMPGKHALLFQNENDYVQLNLPQTVDDLTLAAWVNVVSLRQDTSLLNGLLMSENWNRSGQIHWQLDFEGCMRLSQFGVQNQDGARLWKSSRVFDQARLRHWNHVAVVFDHASRVRFYINGQLTNEAMDGDRSRIPVCIGSARIGGWNEESRTFNGRVDELAIFGRGLGAGEIKKMFEAGKPAKAHDADGQSGR
jgi:hypothetical protein